MQWKTVTETRLRSRGKDSGSKADFGQKIDRSEEWEKEPSRRSGSDSSSSGGSSSSGSIRE